MHTDAVGFRSIAVGKGTFSGSGTTGT